MLSFGVEIEIEGPVNTAGVRAPAYGVDTGFLRDSQGRCILSGDLVRGVVREMLTAMSAAAPDKLAPKQLQYWFGNASGDATGDFEPSRRRVHFHDFQLEEDVKPGLMTRIHVDEETDCAADGMLQVIETAIPVGGSGVFRGRIDVFGGETVQEAENWILKALRLVPALGGVKGAGFGHVLNVRKVECPAPRALRLKSAAASLNNVSRVRYAIEFDGPFLIASQSVSGNIFKGSIVVPGAALKGAFAVALERAGKLGALAKALDKTVFQHAQPVRLQNLDKRPRAIPQSLYSAEEFKDCGGKIHSIEDALVSPPCLWSELGSVITFQDNWKKSGEQKQAAKEHYGHTYSPKYDMRTRTAVNKYPNVTGRGVAATGQLFTYLAPDPGDDHVWVGEIARGEADPAGFEQLISLLAAARLLIGKRPTVATVAILGPAAEPAAAKTKDGAWRLVLQTDALLHGPGDVLTHADAPTAEEQLQRQYRTYFAKALSSRTGGGVQFAPENIELRFYAKQRWAGGYYALRFPNFDDSYYPHLLTEAGSVFELRAPPEADGAMKTFAQRGLPLPATVVAKDFEYRRSPFNPENGYGEVSIDGEPLDFSVPD
jgi:hypothetical protein